MTNCSLPAYIWSNTVMQHVRRLFTGSKHCAGTRWIRDATMRWAHGISGVVSLRLLKNIFEMPLPGLPAEMPILLTGRHFIIWGYACVIGDATRRPMMHSIKQF